MRRILAQKLRRGLFDGTAVDPAAATRAVGTRRAHARVQEVAEDSLTLITDDGAALPLADGATVLVTGAGGAAKLDVVVDELISLGHAATALNGPIPEDAAEAAAAVDTVLVLTSSSGFTTPASQVALAGSGTSVVHAAVRNPYDVVHVGEVAASLATYSTADVSLRALAGVLAGTVKPSGTLPVPIPTADGSGEAFPIGHGLG